MSSMTSAPNPQRPLSGNEGVVCIPSDVEYVLITEDDLRSRVRELGEEITQDYAGKSLLLVGVLKGAAVFLSDLVRAIDIPVDYDFVRISSYGSGTRSSGKISSEGWPKLDAEGRHVLIVEDIVDTGWTLRMSRLEEHCRLSGALTVRICALLDKPARREIEVPLDYRGFEIEDRFVVGYGLDWAGQYRNLPYIGVLRSEGCASG